MKTYAILRPDGSMRSFEITSTWFTFRPLYKILRSVEGVSDVKRNWFNSKRVKFKFLGEPFVVHEDWGDSDRYWVGPANPETSKLDITPLHQAFLSYRGTIIWRWIVRLGEMGTDSDGSAPVFQQSGLAFAAAVVACWAYMSAVSGILSAFGPKELSPVLVIVLLVIPFVFCGLFHFTVVRDSDLSMLQKCVQIIGAAFFAPLLGWLVYLSVMGRSP